MAATEAPAREHMPPERQSVTKTFRLQHTQGGFTETIRFYITVGLHPDGRPGEVFIKADRQGSFASGILDSLGIMISLALQHGVPLATVIEKMKGSRFPPASFTGDSDVPNCTSVLDLLARWLELRFLPGGE